MIVRDTIFALSSGTPPSGVAVIRISGPANRFAIETIANPLPPARTAQYRDFQDADGALLDSGLLLFFPAPHSFTGEDTGEFQIHGGRAVVAAFLARLGLIEGCRHAEPGEFTKRAFLNGKVDLLQAEGLADLVTAETESQRRFAIANAEGGQTTLYAAWRSRLIHARAMIEAELDFADEADVPGSLAAAVLDDIRAMAVEIRDHIAGYAKAEIVRDGYDVVIIGAPNSGKSSLLNAMARRDAAIVTEEPGTTRDLIEVSLDIHGFKVRVTDTAGIRNEAGKIEQIGIVKALERAESAHLILYIEDLLLPAPLPLEGPRWPTLLRLGTKADLLDEGQLAVRRPGYDYVISSRSGQGIDGLVEELGRRAKGAIDGGTILPSRDRHVGLLREAVELLIPAGAGDNLAAELVAEYLRLAGEKLGRISGAVDVEDLLDVIFAQFCIGK